MSKVEVNQVTQQCGTTLTVGGGACKTAVVDATTVTLGRCGGTVSLASGATQSGFGRTGTVDWQTGDIKTAAFIPATGKGYFCNTTGGTISVNLPAGVVGDIIGLKDYAGTWADNAVTLNANGSDKIGGGNTLDPTLTSKGGSVLLVYVDTTQGWLTTQESVTVSPSGSENFIIASGGTPCAGATCGDCRIHTFTGPGTFCVSQLATCAANNVVSYVVLAGGAGGGNGGGGGGGAGGFRETKSPVTPYTASPRCGYPNAPNIITATASPYPIAVGGGGAAASCPGSAARGSSGCASTFDTITSAGGGGAGSGIVAVMPGLNGGSGGGARANHCVSGGTGNTPPTTPAQGTDGGTSTPPVGRATGGGGATVAGQPNTSPTGGAGGTGATTCITGSPVGYGGGGGGGSNGGPVSAGPGSPCGTGPAGAPNCAPVPGNAPNNKGGGGGGGGGSAGPPTAANGGSGVVIVRYKYQ